MTTAADRRWFALTPERLRELFSYDKGTGTFTRIATRGYRWRAGSIAGSRNSDGYLCIKIDGITHKCHRLAFLYVTGEFPRFLVDHINGDRSDNRWANLREATACENTRNAKMPATNTSGVKGVCFHRPTGKWVVRAWDGNGRNRYGGLFDSIDDAKSAAIRLREKLHREFANHGGVPT